MLDKRDQTQRGAKASAPLYLMLAAVGLIILALLVWQLSNVLLLFFGAIVVAVILRSGAEVIEDYTPVKSRGPWSSRLWQSPP